MIAEVKATKGNKCIFLLCDFGLILSKSGKFPYTTGKFFLKCPQNNNKRSSINENSIKLERRIRFFVTYSPSSFTEYKNKYHSNTKKSQKRLFYSST